MWLSPTHNIKTEQQKNSEESKGLELASTHAFLPSDRGMPSVTMVSRVETSNGNHISIATELCTATAIFCQV